jgi:hypothetical protein
MTYKNKLIIFLLVALLVLGWISYDYSQKVVNLSEEDYRPDAGLISAIQSRTWNFEKGVRTSLNSSLIGGDSITTFAGGTFPMTQIVEKGVKNPLTGKTSVPKFAASERFANKVKIAKLISKYGKLVTQASKRFSIPELFIYTVMAVENTDGDTNTVSSGGFVGLMQIDTTSAADSLATQKKRKLLTVNDLQYFKNRFGSSVFNNENAVSNKDLFDSETNISVGTLHISEMIVDNKFDIVKDIHKIFFSYNRGKNRLDNDGTKSLGIDEMINRYLGTRHSVGAEYIIRALGPHGAADILVNDLGITS